MKHEKLIQQLRNQLKNIEQDVLRHDQNLTRQDSKLIQNLERFNSELFHQTGGKLGPCIAQLSRNIDHLERQLKLNLCNDTIMLSCERIQDRFTALMRALGTTRLNLKDAKQTQASKKVSWQRRQQHRHQESGFSWIASSVMQNSHQLYDELNKHLNWAKKIEQKIAQMQLGLEKCPATEKIRLQNEILAMHRRLGKCRQAISYIEERIQLFERPRRDHYR